MNVIDWKVLLILLSGIILPQSFVTEVLGSSSSQPITTLNQDQTDQCRQITNQTYNIHHNKQTSQRKVKEMNDYQNLDDLYNAIKNDTKLYFVTKVDSRNLNLTRNLNLFHNNIMNVMNISSWGVLIMVSSSSQPTTKFITTITEICKIDEICVKRFYFCQVNLPVLVIVAILAIIFLLLQCQHSSNQIYVRASPPVSPATSHIQPSVHDAPLWSNVKEMTDLEKLEDMYYRKIRIDEQHQSYYRGLLRYVEHDLLIPEMRRTSRDFDNLYRNTYYGGSFFDGLKIGSSSQEFDLNIFFKWKMKHCQIVNLGQDPQKKNFCYLRVTKSILSESERKIVFNEGGINYISPKKMYDLLLSTVDRAITNVGTFTYRRQQFRITRHEFAPVTLKVTSVSDPEIFFEVDFVPSFQFDFTNLPEEVRYRVNKIADDYDVREGTRNFMAISLHRADKEKFQLDFHDIERKILYNRGCVKKVIKLLKYMRDEKGGPMAKLWSHLLKTSVMHRVREQPRNYWSEYNLPNCFIDCLENLLKGLKSRQITDVFFPQVNLLHRIKNPQVIDDVVGYIERKLRAFNQEGDILAFF